MIRVRESIEDVPEGVLIWEEEKWKGDEIRPHTAALCSTGAVRRVGLWFNGCLHGLRSVTHCKQMSLRG